MRQRTRRAIGWTIFACTVAPSLGALAMSSDDWPLWATVALASTVTFIAILGVLLVNRRPENAVAWILQDVSFLFAAGLFATQYAERALVTSPGSLPLGGVAAWLQTWLWIPIAGALPLLILLFPTGRPPSRRWWVVGWAAMAIIALVLLTAAFGPGHYETFPAIENPLGVAALAGLQRVTDVIALPGIAAVGVASIASMVVRFRRSLGIERQQLKWFVYVVTAAALLALTNPVMNTLAEGTWEALSFVLPLLGLLLLPLGITGAILRYHLYDIDRLVSRTLSYAIVTGVLLASFAVVTLIPTALFGNVGEVSDAWVAGATLTAAALARPLMRRVRTGVDRRFNRTRYDAVETVEAFASRLREQVDIDVLGAELTSLVDRTMHPEHVRLWIRP